MANKNYAGTILTNTRRYIDRLNDMIDKRDEEGVRHIDNDDNPILNYTTNNEGRCWSF